ncbi:hypothetical protein [Marinimicrobium sp. C2-29]|uniref:hypothetical protein n=1 Tax=Marinimicrobium sp. C2-29 TaxID=3139825 RepID=UPI0031399BC2
MAIIKYLRIFMVSLPLMLVGCGGSGGSDHSGGVAEPPAPDPTPKLDPTPETDPVDNSFSSFVIDQFAATSDETDSQPVDDRQFTFDDEQNSDAFNGLFEGGEN